MTKVCCKCKVEKDSDDFYSKGKLGRLQSYCKKCFNFYCMERWEQYKKEAVIYKGSKCVDCGLEFNGENHYLFDFHHLNPKEKDVNWDKLRLRSESKRKLELDKCVCLCANCHRTRHWKF